MNQYKPQYKPRYKPILSCVIAAAIALPALAAPGREAITPVEIAAAVNRFGIQIAPEQIVLLSNVVATSAHPQLRVESLQRWDSQRMMVRLSCANPGECVPFFVGLRLNQDAGPQSIAQINATATGIPEPSTQTPKVRAGKLATLMLDGDHVHIRLTVICLETGTTGQTIRATDKDRRVVYTAQVADEGLLKGHL
jgi:hypothetical protein